MSARKKVGFVGLGWIGQARLQSLAEADLVDIAVLADPNPDALKAARAFAPGARTVPGFEELLRCELDAVVIATPSGLHGEACQRALSRGLAVFCQKPLGRNASEVASVLDAASAADRLLRVDLCYRQTKALRALRDSIRSGSIGHVYSAELTFHNAYGPDKAWARDWDLAGGGCLIDLGVHLIDAAFWVLGGSRAVRQAFARRYAAGQALSASSSLVEDFAVGQLELEDATSLSIACSWQSSFGDHARIRLALYGSTGGAAFENVNGSFFDFRAERFQSASRQALYEGTDDWSGRAIVSFAEELTESPRYRADDQLLPVAHALDGLYGRSASSTPVLAPASMRAAS